MRNKRSSSNYSQAIVADQIVAVVDLVRIWAWSFRPSHVLFIPESIASFCRKPRLSRQVVTALQCLYLGKAATLPLSFFLPQRPRSCQRPRIFSESQYFQSSQKIRISESQYPRHYVPFGGWRKKAVAQKIAGNLFSLLPLRTNLEDSDRSEAPQVTTD